MVNNYDGEAYETYSLADESYESDSSSEMSNKVANPNIYSKRNNYKNSDPGYHKISFRSKKKKVKQEFYSTGMMPGTKIRNAITGYYEDVSVGSMHENLCFKVIDTSCRFDKINTPLIFFYESPEQYERHNNSVLNDETKQIWNEKYEFTQKQMKV